MKRVYLDQAEWVEFSRASQGRHADPKVADALAIARYGVRQGLLSFPLSSSHYMETMGTTRWRQREPLAAVMAELSQFQTIADQRRILDMELDLALRRRFGRPYEVRAVAIFGHGVAHAFGEPTLAEIQSPDLRDLLDRQPALARKVGEARELAMLAGPPEDLPVPWLRTDAHHAPAQRFRSGQQDLGADLRAAGFGKGRLPRGLIASELVGILDRLNEAIGRAGLSADRLDGQDALTEFFLDLPTRRVAYEMLLARHRNPEQTWKPNDLNDFAALGVAVPYCDVVVTERHWRGLLRAAHLDREYSTVILDDVRELPEVLVAA